MLSLSAVSHHSLASLNVPPTGLSDRLHIMSNKLINTKGCCATGGPRDWSCCCSEWSCVKHKAADITEVGINITVSYTETANTAGVSVTSILPIVTLQ